jgi:LacI family transcriptional regulator
MARRRQSITIKHVAADAGVSLQTVSRVINDGPNVRPEMRERVQASIDRLGYVPSLAAQRMSGSRSYLILALNDRERTIAEWEARQGSDWVDQMLFGGMLTAGEHGYRLMFELIDTHADHIERELGAALAAVQPDGVILTPPHSENATLIQLLDRENIPFARIGSREQGAGIALTMDDDGHARLATEYLAGLGHQRIGFISGSPEYSLSHWRVEGWREAMKDAGLPTEDLLAAGDFTYASGEKAARQLLTQDQPPTAIIASSDQMALATLDTARDLGISVPEQLSIVSFDNTPVTNFTRPTLTAIDQPIAKTTSRAVELLIEAGRKGAVPDAPVNVSGRLIERGSTAPPPPAGNG